MGFIRLGRGRRPSWAKLKTQLDVKGQVPPVKLKHHEFLSLTPGKVMASCSSWTGPARLKQSPQPCFDNLPENEPETWTLKVPLWWKYFGKYAILNYIWPKPQEEQDKNDDKRRHTWFASVGQRYWLWIWQHVDSPRRRASRQACGRLLRLG